MGIRVVPDAEEVDDCDAMGIRHGVTLTFGQPVPGDSVDVANRGTDQPLGR